MLAKIHTLKVLFSKCFIKIFENATSWLGNYNDLLKTKIRIRLEKAPEILGKGKEA